MYGRWIYFFIAYLIILVYDRSPRFGKYYVPQIFIKSDGTPRLVPELLVNRMRFQDWYLGLVPRIGRAKYSAKFADIHRGIVSMFWESSEEFLHS